MSQYIRSTIKRGALGYALESSYLNTEALGATSDLCAEIKRSGNYAWTSDGKCKNKTTGKLYPGPQSQSNCTCLGPPPKTAGDRASDALDFLWGAAKDKFLPHPNQIGPSRQPDPSFTASGMLIPAVAVVGVVGLILVLKKKKK
jgi:hypothetical protein